MLNNTDQQLPQVHEVDFLEGEVVVLDEFEEHEAGLLLLELWDEPDFLLDDDDLELLLDLEDDELVGLDDESELLDLEDDDELEHFDEGLEDDEELEH